MERHVGERYSTSQRPNPSSPSRRSRPSQLHPCANVAPLNPQTTQRETPLPWLTTVIKSRNRTTVVSKLFKHHSCSHLKPSGKVVLGASSIGLATAELACPTFARHLSSGNSIPVYGTRNQGSAQTLADSIATPFPIPSAATSWLFNLSHTQAIPLSPQTPLETPVPLLHANEK